MKNKSLLDWIYYQSREKNQSPKQICDWLVMATHAIVDNNYNSLSAEELEVVPFLKEIQLADRRGNLSKL